MKKDNLDLECETAGLTDIGSVSSGLLCFNGRENFFGKGQKNENTNSCFLSLSGSK